MMQESFLRAPLAKLGTLSSRIALSATYRPGWETVFRALDEGINYFFYFGFDTQVTRVLPEVIAGRRDQFVLATGAYNWIWGHQDLRRTLEKRLRQMRTDYIDVFHFLGVTRRWHFTERVREELQRVRESGLVRGVAVSTHDRGLAAEVVRNGEVDAVMVRYNAGSRGAEAEVFPYVPAESKPAVIGYTATRWTQLLRRPRGYPAGGRLPSAGMCYRFVLSHPAVNVCVMAPRNLRQFEQNMAEVRLGPLDEEDLGFMQSFGSIVRGRYFRES